MNVENQKESTGINSTSTEVPLEKVIDTELHETTMLREISGAEDKKILESAGFVLFSDVDEKTKLKAIDTLSKVESKRDEYWEKEVELLANVYNKEPSSKVRIAILDEFEASLTLNILAVDKIVFAAKFEKDMSVKKRATNILRKAKKDGIINGLIDNLSEKDIALKNRYILLVNEMKDMGI